MHLTKFGVMMFCLNALFLSTIGITASEVNLRLPAIFSDNMVLQQGQAIPVWGWADPGTYITVELCKQGTKGSKFRFSASTDKTGKWLVRLRKCDVGGPYELRIWAHKGYGKNKTIKFNNVMVGEVWLCSGQSNMEMPVGDGWGKVLNYERETTAAKYPNIRLITVPHKVVFAPQNDFESKGWVECSPASVDNFSAVAYFFGRHLHKKLNVPIGLIQSAYGGTRSEAWTSAEALNQFPDFAKEIAVMKDTPADPELAKKDYETKLAKWTKELTDKDPGFNNGEPLWANPELDTKDWKPMAIPQLWEDAGLTNFDGTVWFRKEINLDASWVGKDLVLSLGPTDDRDITWFNGTKIGSTDFFNIPRKYTIPSSLVKPGKNVIVVRILDTGGAGGFSGKPLDMQLLLENATPIPLSGTWLYKLGFDLTTISSQPLDPKNPYHPTVLYNGMIAPIVPYAIRGAIWYQGESNAGRAYRYREMFPTLINDWREHWNQGEFPFLFVQLANWMGTKPEPADDAWAELREAQSMTLSLPNTGMAVAIDIGDAADIHPKNKQEVGNRLALIARAKIYQENLVYSGPLYQSFQIEGNKIRIKFSHTGKGLMIKGDSELKGFAIAGSDKKFYWANANIDGKTVLVSSEKVPNPVAVRYAWAANPICNLYNQEGLPASPFRTDFWHGITEGNK
jgi:sialate O-acetylesterase